MSKILVIDDEIEICLILDKFLTKKGFEVVTAHTGNDGLAKLKNNTFDLIISDFRLPDFTGLDLLKEIKAIRQGNKVIIITGYSDIRMAVEVIKYGAIDYITKPLYPEELLSLINQSIAGGGDTSQKSKPGDTAEIEAVQSGKTKPAVKSAPPQRKEYIIGKSKPSRAIQQNIEIVAPTPMSVIITGETGTGKEYVAKEIHRLSKRNTGPFVAIDCGALPKDLAASEFFGHEKGAFTGALREKDGKFKYADGGTLFLDEIGNLSYEVQMKLLRVLQERKFTRVGGNKDISVDVRLLVATNEDLKKAVEEGDFREDLYYRLNEFSIELNPIRSRTEDLEEFVESFIAIANEQLDKKVKGVDPEVLEKFKSYNWPGNLRELRNVIKRSVLLAKDDMIDISTLPEEIIYNSNTRGESNINSLKGVANEAERERILKVLTQTGNNKSKAAKILNIDRKTLYNKLKNYDL